MAGETPDWGALSAQATVFPVTDLGELAARLGSIVTFDRRGDVVWLDSFEEGLNKWAVTIVGAGASVGLSNVRVRMGLFSARLVAGSDSGRYAQIEHPYAIPSLSNLGVEYSFARGATTDNLLTTLDINTGTRFLEPRIRYDDILARFLYRDAAGVDQVLATGVFFPSDDRRFNTIKLVVDLAAERYVRLVVNTVTYDMSGIAFSASNDSTAANARLFIRNTGDAGANRTVYIDDVILSQNEPAQP